MSYSPRPGAVAAFAAVVLLIDVTRVTASQLDKGPDVTIGDGIGDPTDGATDGTGADGDGSTIGATDGPTDGSTTGTGDGTSTGDGSGTGDGTGSEGTGAPAESPEVAALRSPAVGTYTYDSGGTWSLDTAGVREDHTLPTTAEATVSIAGAGRWGYTVVAGPDYSDSFTFTFADEELMWVGWELFRRFDIGNSTTTYECSSTDPFHVPDNEKGRNIEHGCTGPLGLRSSGPVVTVGYEALTLADGTKPVTVHLRYEYTVGNADTTGGGTLDLWLDPATGLRVKEARTITSVHTDPQTKVKQTYTESVRMLLRSVTPA